VDDCRLISVQQKKFTFLTFKSVCSKIFKDNWDFKKYLKLHSGLRNTKNDENLSFIGIQMIITSSAIEFFKESLLHQLMMLLIIEKILAREFQ